MRRAFYISAISAAIFLSSFHVSVADDYLKGVTAFEQGDHAVALSYWLPMAESGDAKAQYSLGKLYETGGQDGVVQYKEAIRWYLQAAEQGIAAAQNNLGRLFAQGLGADVDREKAVHYWQLASQSKHAMAQYNLGLAYFRGEGIEQNIEQSVFWFHQSANNGVGGAQYALGEVYRLGLSVPKDMGEARKWYKKSAETGNERAALKVIEVETVLAKEKREADAQAADALVEEVNTVAEKVEAEAKGSSVADKEIVTEQNQNVSPATSQVVALSIEMHPKPIKNPRRFAGVGTLFVSKPKPNPRR
ncbi:tetratricopeptide repeat protein [Kiloniella sp.]|uniref:tetratricopeptide repeat protein n=1 Tax=Kiloniella sp. TaxID=1938587 RepID=UPI003B016CF5